MDIVEQHAGLVKDVVASITQAQKNAGASAATQIDKDLVESVFTGVAHALDSHPMDAQATVTASVHTTPLASKVYVDITVVPSEAVRAVHEAEVAAAGEQAAERAEAVNAAASAGVAL